MDACRVGSRLAFSLAATDIGAIMHATLVVMTFPPSCCLPPLSPQSVEACFRSRDAPSALGELHASLAAQLGDLMAVVRGAGLSQLERRVLVALITTDVHNRDVVDALIHRWAGAAALLLIVE